MYSFANPFESSFGPGSGRRGHHGWGPQQPPHRGPHDGRSGFGPHGRFPGQHIPPFWPHGHRGFGPFPPRRPEWGPEDDGDYSSSDEDEKPPKKREEDSSSDSSDSSSESEVECHRKGRKHGGRGHRGGGGHHCPDHHHRRHHSRDHGRHGRHHHGGRDHGHHRRHGGGGHCWPPHWPPHRHHHRRGPWGPEVDEDLPVEDASGFGSDYQVIQNDITTEMNNLQLQDVPQDKSSKKCFKVALNADGFKVKDIRIRRNKGQLLVEGKQNAKTYLGTFQRSFSYTITIPSGINPKKIKTKLGPDGVLRIKAKKNNEESDNEEVEEIPIKE
jgi:hypothetical protein